VLELLLPQMNNILCISAFRRRQMLTHSDLTDGRTVPCPSAMATTVASAMEDAIVVVCLSVSNFAKKLLNGFTWNFQRRLASSEQTIKFWWRSGIQIQIRIATLVRCALAEVCTVPVLLVVHLSVSLTFISRSLWFAEHFWFGIYVCLCYSQINQINPSLLASTNYCKIIIPNSKQYDANGELLKTCIGLFV